MPIELNGQTTYRKPNLHSQVVHEIALRILRGDLRVGETLPNETDFTAELGVSRTVLREATKALAAKGLVESRTKTGTRVRPRDQWNLLDPDVLAWEYEAGPSEQFLQKLTEVRMAIEPFASKVAAERATRKELAAIQDAYAGMEATVHDVDAFIEADMQFHAAILAASHNDLLEQLINAISVPLVHSRKVTTQIPGSSEQSLPLHWAVLDAICRRDGRVARAAMQSLVAEAGQDIHRVLHERNTHGRRGRSGMSEQQEGV